LILRLPGGQAAMHHAKRMRPPTEAALLRLAVKGRDLMIALPKLHVMTVG
jgi:hypothetical protein